MNPITPEFREAVMQLFYWQYGSSRDNFSSILYMLMQKADSSNQAKFQRGFPNEFLAWQCWQRSEDPEAFFKEYGFDRSIL